MKIQIIHDDILFGVDSYKEARELLHLLESDNKEIVFTDDEWGFIERCIDSGDHRVLTKIMGQRGGDKGGIARKDALSPERRKEIARNAALARWGAVGRVYRR